MSGDWNIDKMARTGAGGGTEIEKMRRGKALTLVDVYDMAADIGKVGAHFLFIWIYLCLSEFSIF